MANINHAKTATVFEYRILRVNAFTTGTPPSGAKPIGKGVATTTATTVIGGTTTVIAVADATNITKGMKLYIFGGGLGEGFLVKAVSGFNVTVATPFVNSYSGTSQIGSNNGTFLNPLVVKKAGDASCVLTLYDGNPNLSGAPGLPADYGRAIAAITNPVPAGNYNFQGRCDYGLFYTLTGTTPPELTFASADAAQPLTL